MSLPAPQNVKTRDDDTIPTVPLYRAITIIVPAIRTIAVATMVLSDGMDGTNPITTEVGDTTVGSGPTTVVHPPTTTPKENDLTLHREKGVKTLKSASVKSR